MRYSEYNEAAGCSLGCVGIILYLLIERFIEAVIIYLPVTWLLSFTENPPQVAFIHFYIFWFVFRIFFLKG